MPLQIVRNDITKMRVDAVVNPTDPNLTGDGGADGAIRRAAGPGLLKECRKLGGCGVGEAKLTRGHRLPCKYVIHTVGPRWQGGAAGERESLRACYLNSLELAAGRGCDTVAFPLIASGAFGFPKDEALRIAVDSIGAFLMEHELTVYLVVYDKRAWQISGRLFADLEEYIDDNYVDARADSRVRRYRMAMEVCCATAPSGSLEDALNCLDESFSEMLLRKIDERGMTDAQCYKKANIDRKLFSKIRSDRLYRPSKPTALAFAIALELPLEETRELLMKAGFALSHSNKFDVIVEYFIKNGRYSVLEINEALFAFDQSLLGGSA